MSAYDDAKAFFMEKWGDERIGVHSECVIECCRSMIRNTDLDGTVFDIAGWIHDLGRKDDKDKHHIIGLDYLDEFMRVHPEYNGLRYDVADCIHNHRGAQSPQTLYGRIMQAADKVSLHHERWKAYSVQLNS